MKRIIIFIAALFTVLSCTEKDITTPKPGYKIIELKAVAGQPSGEIAKTVLNGTSVEWKENDKILVLDDQGDTTTLTAQSSGSSTTFKSDKVPSEFGDIQYAFYPADSYKNLDFEHKTITLKLPKSTTIAESFKYNPSYAYVNGAATAEFKNICGILCITIQNTIYSYYADVPKTIEVVAKNDKKISGEFLFYYEDGTLEEDNGESVKTIEESSGFKRIGEDETWVLNYIIPPGAFDGGIEIKAIGWGASSKSSITKGTKVKTERSKITQMPIIFWLSDAYGNESGISLYNYL